MYKDLCHDTYKDAKTCKGMYNGIDDKMHCDMSRHHAVQYQTVRM
jgi:hypothetical protein